MGDKAVSDKKHRTMRLYLYIYIYIYIYTMVLNFILFGKIIFILH